MSQVRDKRQNNVRAGVFVTITFILALVVFSILTNAWNRIFSTTSTYHAVFSIRDGVGMLSTGSKVRLGGVLVGSVLQVIPRSESVDPTSVIDVLFTIDNSYDLYENATVHSRAGLLGSSAWISISSVGNGKKATASTELIGTTETMATQLLGSDAEINISKSLESLRKLSDALTNDGGALNVLLGSRDAEGIKNTIDSASASLDSLKTILDSAKNAWPTWETSITSILMESKSLPKQMNETLLKIQNSLTDIRTHILPSVEQSMQSLESTMSSLEAMSKTYQSKSPVWAAEISSIIGNVTQLSTRAKAAIDEISASPWRLLYRPTDREIAYEQLNAASWQLQSALSDLRISAQALQVASQSPNAPEDMSSIAMSLTQSADEFEKARKAVETRMQVDFPNR
jgi:ABC-type transporter Mla subunit MlaD